MKTKPAKLPARHIQAHPDCSLLCGQHANIGNYPTWGANMLSCQIAQVVNINKCLTTLCNKR